MFPFTRLRRRPDEPPTGEPEQTAGARASHLRRATFAAGCFWGVEASFRELDGVEETAAGYTGGHTPDPTYRQVCGHDSGHAEAVEVWFDPSRVSYAELLDRFWAIQTPTIADAHEWNLTGQYRSAIFFDDLEQQAQAITSREERQRSQRATIATEITPASAFHRAEEHHQRYLEKQGRRIALRRAV